MRQALNAPACSSDNVVNDKTAEHSEINKHNLYDIQSGEPLSDIQKIRLKLSSEERAIISLLQHHYGKQLGKEITLSQLIAILLEKELKSQFELDFSAIKRALEAGFKVEMPKISLPQFSLKKGAE
jgi:hypothetical protein